MSSRGRVYTLPVRLVALVALLSSRRLVAVACGHSSYTHGMNNAILERTGKKTNWVNAVVRPIDINLTSWHLRSLVPHPPFGAGIAHPQLELKVRFQTFRFWASASPVLKMELELWALLPRRDAVPGAYRWLEPAGQRRHTEPSPRQPLCSTYSTKQSTLHSMKKHPYTHESFFVSKHPTTPEE